MTDLSPAKRKKPELWLSRDLTGYTLGKTEPTWHGKGYWCVGDRYLYLPASYIPLALRLKRGQKVRIQITPCGKPERHG